MEPENRNKSATDESFTDENVSFSHVSAVANGLFLDFVFLSLCRFYKEEKVDEFDETLSTLEGINSALKRDNEKTKISAFLARLMYGKQLDVQFEEDLHVMPLMSALKIWTELEDTVADKTLFKNVSLLLLVQSVAVCLEKGQTSSASSALKWFENNYEFPQNLVVKLSKILAQGETYHPFFKTFNFSRLLETVQAFLDAYLEKNPSDYLLKAATKMVQSSQSSEAQEDVATEDSSPYETSNKSAEDRTPSRKEENTVCLRTKRKLMSTKITDMWKPDTCKKPVVSVKRLSRKELLQITQSEPSPKNNRTRKPYQKWTAQLDKYLKDGVRRHGQGKWAQILLDYDFNGRTGTMLKDRWRVLMRADKVC